MAYADGEHCPAETPDAGDVGFVQVMVWPSFQPPGVNDPFVSKDPSHLALAGGQLITVAFVPKGATIPKPFASTVTTLIQLLH